MKVLAWLEYDRARFHIELCFPVSVAVGARTSHFNGLKPSLFEGVFLSVFLFEEICFTTEIKFAFFCIKFRCFLHSALNERGIDKVDFFHCSLHDIFNLRVLEFGLRIFDSVVRKPYNRIVLSEEFLVVELPTMFFLYGDHNNSC